MSDEVPEHLEEKLRKVINKSGFPFQIAVEHHIRQNQDSLKWRVIHSEYPAGDGFVDLLLARDEMLAAIECKRTTSAWIFPMPHPAQFNQTLCRVEYYNGRAPDPMGAALKDPFADRVFCSDYNMCEGSPEAEFAITKHQGSTAPTLEQMSSELLVQSHSILAAEDRHRASDYELMIPIIVTTADLYTCTYTPTEAQVEDGQLGDDEGSFEEAEFVRFRKSLVSERSDHFRRDSLSAEEWYADRERTVFVVQAGSLDFFLKGFRSFTHNVGGDYPPEYADPPWGSPSWLA